MADEVYPPMLCHHMVVQVLHYLLIFGGHLLDGPLPLNVIWMYNLYTDLWRKYEIAESEMTPPDTLDACAVAIKDVVYMFGGYKVSTVIDSFTNDLWELKRTSQGHFVWHEGHKCDKMNSPSPRVAHCAWEHAGKLWIFGGISRQPRVTHEYLDDYGDFYENFNNQLLSFSPSCKEWANVKCAGSVPAPRGGHAATILCNKVFLYGGCNGSTVYDEMYELNMSSLTWTEIQTEHPKPQGRKYFSLVGASDTKLVLHGGDDSASTQPGPQLSDTWVLDLLSLEWQKYTSVADHPRWCHKSSTGFNSCSAIVIGGATNYPKESYDAYTPTFHVMLETKSLQQLAIQTIYNQRDHLPWKLLPEKLINYIGIKDTE